MTVRTLKLTRLQSELNGKHCAISE
jgi:hypothetical protein